MTFKPNQSYKARLFFSCCNPVKVHIMYVLPSFYDDQKIIIYRYWSKHRKHWIETMCFDHEMEKYIFYNKK